MTLVVNIFGGPGVGKSTIAAELFAILKKNSVEAELVTEYAKDLVWEGRKDALVFQPYVTAKQMFRIHRLIDKVDVIITDSPILLGLVYRGKGYGHAWAAHIMEVFQSWNTLNILLLRNNDNEYVEHGRNQNYEEAKAVDEQMLHLLKFNLVPYTAYSVHEATAQQISWYILSKLGKPL